MHLMPLYMRMYSMKRDWEKVQEYNVMDCMECGSCAFACPAHRRITASIREGKAAYRGEVARLTQPAKEA